MLFYIKWTYQCISENCHQSYLGHCKCLHDISLTCVTVVVLLATVAK